MSDYYPPGTDCRVLRSTVRQQCALGHEWEEEQFTELGQTFSEGPTLCPECGLLPGRVSCDRCGEWLTEAEAEGQVGWDVVAVPPVEWLCERCQEEVRLEELPDRVVVSAAG